MQALLYTGEKALDRLSKLGIPLSVLKEAVLQGYKRRAETTANHPKHAPGYIMWAEIVATLRDQLKPLGWFKVNKKIMNL